jgi:TolA-binding protein
MSESIEARTSQEIEQLRKQIEELNGKIERTDKEINQLKSQIREVPDGQSWRVYPRNRNPSKPEIVLAIDRISEIIHRPPRPK